MAGTPLTTVLEQKKKEAAAIKVSLQIGSVIYDQDYVSRGYKIYGEILGILESLKTCDDKVHYLLLLFFQSFNLDFEFLLQNQ